MDFIDTHAHIYTDKILANKNDVIERAKKAGISKILMPNIDKNSIDAMLSLYKEFPNFCYPMLGLHPTDVKEDYKAELEEIFNQFSEDYIAIGEIGLDLYWDKTTLNIQTEALKMQIEFALSKNLPISVHVREAFPETLAVLEEYRGKGLRGVLHCFTGTLAQAEQLIDLGFFLGIGGVLTFKNGGVDKTITHINIEHLILETDSPYLAPTPYRGKMNEPAYLINVAQKLAEVKNITIEEVAEQTTANAIKLFNLN